MDWLTELRTAEKARLWDNFRPVSERELAALERRLGRRLPDDFRAFCCEIGYGAWPRDLGGHISSPDEIMGLRAIKCSTWRVRTRLVTSCCMKPQDFISLAPPFARASNGSQTGCLRHPGMREMRQEVCIDGLSILSAAGAGAAGLF